MILASNEPITQKKYRLLNKIDLRKCAKMYKKSSVVMVIINMINDVMLCYCNNVIIITIE